MYFNPPATSKPQAIGDRVSTLIAKKRSSLLFLSFIEKNLETSQVFTDLNMSNWVCITSSHYRHLEISFRKFVTSPEGPLISSPENDHLDKNPLLYTSELHFNFLRQRMVYEIDK